MVVMDADRFGVSQLHQLRGRVGRGGEPRALCLLVTPTPLGSPARERLAAVAATTDGFARRAGSTSAAAGGGRAGRLAQSGGRGGDCSCWSLLSDEQLIAAAREEAAAVVAGDPELARHPGLSGAISDLLGPQRAEFLDKT